MNNIKTYGGGRNSGPLQEKPTAFRPDFDLTTYKSEIKKKKKKGKHNWNPKSCIQQIGGTLILFPKLQTVWTESGFGSIANTYGSK